MRLTSMGLTACLVLSSCGARTGLEITDAPQQDACTPVRITEDGVDVLFVVDNSGSMREEQATLIREIPRLVRSLSTGDRNGDGRQEFEPIASLHVGVVTTDLGAGNQRGLRTCAAGLGDDGILRRRVRERSEDCMPGYASGTFEFLRGQDDEAFSTTIGCVVNLGTAGCGFDQQLEAPLKALSPANAQIWTAEGYAPPRFYEAETGLPNRLAGHGMDANAGFLRPNSVLAIVLVTDEEDCSVMNYEIFSGAGRFAGVPPNIRCNQFANEADTVYPVSRYVNGFAGLRRSPELLVFSAIVGIPPATETAADANDFAAVLGHPDMQPRVDGSGTMLSPSCMTPSGSAYPPIRIVQTASALHAIGASVALTSICSNSFAHAFEVLINRVEVAIDACY